MNFLHTDIGSAKDNFGSPIHNWYKFTAGFSYKFVDEIIRKEKLLDNPKSKIFDPFAGCGTTLVSAQKNGVLAVGNEAQDFMFEIIQAKLGWDLNFKIIEKHILQLKNFISSEPVNLNTENYAHPLLQSLYTQQNLRALYLIKKYIGKISTKKYKLFFKLALSQTLHKVSIHPIAVPYISRNKILKNSESTWDVFSNIAKKMTDDIQGLTTRKQTSKIHLQDSRFINKSIKANSCTICITSPPYLNNLDYGEVSKVHTHFFGTTENWADITEKVRKKLITGATTHYVESNFSLNKFKNSTFYKHNKNIADSLIKRYKQIKKISAKRAGKKSFHILMLLYFQDMYKVLLEIRRILTCEGKAFLILGDSAPYGIFIPTTKMLGKIAINAGFESFKIHKIRVRGTKWKSLTYRHSLELSENVLVIS